MGTPADMMKAGNLRNWKTSKEGGAGDLFMVFGTNNLEGGRLCYDYGPHETAVWAGPPGAVKDGRTRVGQHQGSAGAQRRMGHQHGQHTRVAGPGVAHARSGGESTWNQIIRAMETRARHVTNLSQPQTEVD